MQVSERTLDEQAEQLDRLLTGLIKKYQFRDRNEVCCEGITVSQCYALKELGAQGSVTMSRLAELMCLSLSALTRVVDQLERRRYAKRRRLESDRRVCCVELTATGRTLLRVVETKIRRSEKEVLARLSDRDRAGLITGLRRLSAALDERTACCEPKVVYGK